MEYLDKQILNTEERLLAYIALGDIGTSNLFLRKTNRWTTNKYIDQISQTYF